MQTANTLQLNLLTEIGDLWCLNATTGAVIWSKMDGGSAGAISDGYLTFENKYTGYMDIFGKGTSATTVSMPQTQITSGTKVIISGTVLDQSPGIVAASTSPIGATAPMKNNRGLVNVACVSDASMSTYMEYLYDQQPIDGMYHNMTVTGVPVTITAIDPNGNPVTIGNVTSDESGCFAFTWQPTMAGEYTISASFRRFQCIWQFMGRNCRNSSRRSSSHSNSNTGGITSLTAL